MSLTDNAWIDVPIIVAALLAAWYTIWRRGLKPVAHAVQQITETVPIIVNLGTTLGRIEGKADEGTAVMAAHIEADRVAFKEIHATLCELKQPIANIEQAITNGK